MIKKLDVLFEAKISKSKYCICTACHDVGMVTKVKLPETLYFDGTNLSTKHNEYWLCAKCRTKLTHALNCPKNDGELNPCPFCGGYEEKV